MQDFARVFILSIDNRKTIDKMKSKNILYLLLGLLVTLSISSCDDDDSRNYVICPNEVPYNALVTVKPNADNTSVYLQLDDKTTVFPSNLAKSPFGTKEVRALAVLNEVNDKTEGYDKTAFVGRLDSIRTKDLAANLGDDNAKTYGTDPVEIVKDWVTIAEDGYLTLRFRTNWGGMKTHLINLVATNPDKPYELTLYHDANGDASNYAADGLVAFRITSLPDTEGKTVDLTLKWNSFSGEKTATFKYCSRKQTGKLDLKTKNPASLVVGDMSGSLTSTKYY